MAWYQLPDAGVMANSPSTFPLYGARFGPARPENEMPPVSTLGPSCASTTCGASSSREADRAKKKLPGGCGCPRCLRRNCWRAHNRRTEHAVVLIDVVKTARRLPDAIHDS